MKVLSVLSGAAVVAIAALISSADAIVSYFPNNGPTLFPEVDPKVGCSYMDGTVSFEVTFKNSKKLPSKPVKSSLSGSVSWIILVDTKCAAATGYESVMINWNPIGHVPAGVWNTSHFDVHAYYGMKNPNEQFNCGGQFFCMCDGSNKDAADVCKKPTSNLPMDPVRGLDLVPMGAGLANMGLHYLDPFSLLTTYDQWTIPAPMMGSYKGEISFAETMFTQIVFDLELSLNQPIAYKHQTDYWLPYSQKTSFTSDGNAKIEFISWRKCESFRADKQNCRKNPYCVKAKMC